MKLRQWNKHDQCDKITFSIQYYFNLPERPFHAIKNKTKKVEGRAMKDENDRYKDIKQGDTIVFENEENHQQINTFVRFVHHYTTVKDMLETEGVENVLSSRGTIEEGIQSYNNIGDYKKELKNMEFMLLE